MIHADQKVTPPQVWPPVADGLDKPDQLTFISRELEMTCIEWPAEEGEWSVVLVENRAEPGARRITVHGELLCEVEHLEYRACRQSPLERLELHVRLIGPSERILAQEASQRGYDDAEVTDVLPIVASEAQEAA